MTHYLMLGEKTVHAKELTTFLTLLQKGMDGMEAARKAFGEPGDFEKRIEDYVRQASFYYYRFKAPADIDEKTFPARELGSAESAAVRGDFHAHMRRPKEARALLEEAMKLDPKLAAARETMGLLYYQERKLDEALKWFAEAVRFDSKSFLANYYFGMLSAQDTDAPESTAAAETGLRRSIGLNPEFAPAYSALARLYAQQGDKLEQALAMARKAAQLEPGELTHHLAVANILFRMEKIEDARNLASRVMTAAKTDVDRDAAAAFLGNIQRYEANLAERKRYLAEVQSRHEEEQKRKHEQTVQESKEEAPVQAVEETSQSKGDARAPSAVRGPITRTQGRIIAARCNGVTLDLTLDYQGYMPQFHSENYFKIEFVTTGWQPPQDFQPCTHLTGREVTIRYTDVAGKPYAGEIVTIEIRK